MLLCALASPLHPQAAPTIPAADTLTPLPDARTLLNEVARNQAKLEALQKDYTYHVHLVQQQIDKHGNAKKIETTDSESVTVEGVRIDRIVARDGKPLTPEEQAKENERIEKEVAKARERRAKAANKGEDTDPSGRPIVPLSRILELGTFSNPRRITLEGRPTLVLDFTGDPKAKTRNQFETVIRDLVGTVSVDEQDRVLVRGEAHFVNDFKVGGGLLADIHKGSAFDFHARRMQDAVWLPATIDGSGSVRVLLLMHFDGRLHLETSDYRRFRTSATILQGHGVIGPDGQPEADPATPASLTKAPEGSGKP